MNSFPWKCYYDWHFLWLGMQKYSFLNERPAKEPKLCLDVAINICTCTENISSLLQHL